MTTRKQTAVKKVGYAKVRKLIKEALKLADDKAVELAKALYDSAIEGHVLSARLLVELAEGNLDVEEAMTKGPLRSLALRLEEQAQMPQEPQDAAAETETGSPQLVEV
jgi:hypothetical protein